MSFVNFTMSELKDIIRQYNIHTKIVGYSRMTKAVIIAEMEKHLEFNNNNIVLKNHNIIIVPKTKTVKPKPVIEEVIAQPAQPAIIEDVAEPLPLVERLTPKELVLVYRSMQKTTLQIMKNSIKKDPDFPEACRAYDELRKNIDNTNSQYQEILAGQSKWRIGSIQGHLIDDKRTLEKRMTLLREKLKGLIAGQNSPINLYNDLVRIYDNSEYKKRCTVYGFFNRTYYQLAKNTNKRPQIPSRITSAIRAYEYIIVQFPPDQGNNLHNIINTFTQFCQGVFD